MTNDPALTSERIAELRKLERLSATHEDYMDMYSETLVENGKALLDAAEAGARGGLGKCPACGLSMDIHPPHEDTCKLALAGIADFLNMKKLLAEKEAKLQRAEAANAKMREVLENLRNDYQHYDCMSDHCDACYIDGALADAGQNDEKREGA